MKKELNLNKNIIKWIMLFIGLAAYIFSNGRWNIPIVAWMWPLCILFYFRISDKALLKLFPLPIMVAIAYVKWHGVGGGSLLQEFLLGFINGIVYYLPFLTDSLFYKRVKGYKATFILPLSFATADFFMSLSPVANSDCLAASQAGNDSIMQLASLCGVFGITFMLVWFSTSVMYVFENYKDVKKYRFAIKIFVVFMVGVLGLGGARLALAPTDVPSVRMAMTTGINIGDFTEDSTTLPVEKSISSLKKSVKTAAEGGAELIEFNEEAFTVYDTDLDSMLSALKQSAFENNIAVLLGLEIEDTDNSNNGLGENKAYLVDPKGEIVFAYDKTNLVPVVETNGYIKSNGKVPNEELTLPSGMTIKVASVICMDSAFSGFVRDGVDKNTDLFLVPAWDWEPIDNYQDNWVVYRSIENGFTTMYCTYDGLLAVFDQYGRTVTRNDTDSVGFEHVVFAEVPIKRVHTFYKAFGFIIDWCYPAALLLIIASGFIKKRKETENE